MQNFLISTVCIMKDSQSGIVLSRGSTTPQRDHSAATELKMKSSVFFAAVWVPGRISELGYVGPKSFAVALTAFSVSDFLITLEGIFEACPC